jgi:hypothetical protein
MTSRHLLFILVGAACWQATAGERPWYTQGNFEPASRLEFRLVNTLDFERQNAPVVIGREHFPVPDVHEMRVTVVDKGTGGVLLESFGTPDKSAIIELANGRASIPFEPSGDGGTAVVEVRSQTTKGSTIQVP